MIAVPPYARVTVSGKLRSMPCLLLALLLLLARPLHAAELKLATWNIAWLTLRPASDPILPRDLVPRDAADFARLAGYAQRLDADIVALQEVDGPAAAARIFDPGQYAFYFPDEADVQRSGFAVRWTLRVMRNPDLAALDLHPNARFSLRRGADITVESGGQRLRLVSIHLKAGCREERLLPPSSPDCDSLSRQAAILAEWIAARRREGVAFAIAGDFNRRLGAPGDTFLPLLERAAPLLRATEGLSNPCWSGVRKGQPFVDHILLGGGAERRWLPDSLRVMVYAERGGEWRDRLSDHCPVSLRLQLP